MQEVDYLKLIIGPLATAILTTFAVVIKDWVQKQSNSKRDLKEKMLLELYNKLFTMSMKYNGLLKISYNEEIYWVEESGEERTHDKPYIKDYDIWDKAIKETSEIVYEKIHLLRYDDLIQWSKVRDELPGDFDVDGLGKYYAFRDFQKKIKKTYETLYNDFHFSSRKRRRLKLKNLKARIKEVKNNPFLSKADKQAMLVKIKKNMQSFRKRKD
nr:hypothetical protein [Paenibacillus polymyxa]